MSFWNGSSFGKKSQSDAPVSAPRNSAAPAPVPELRQPLRLPETEREDLVLRQDGEWEAVFTRAVLLPRTADALEAARKRRPRLEDLPGMEVKLNELSEGVFNTAIGGRKTLDLKIRSAIASRESPLLVIMWPLYNGYGYAEEGVAVVSPELGDLGMLQSDLIESWNSLLLNFELRTGEYLCAHARYDAERDALVTDLCEYEVAWNKCNQWLHERNAGAVYK